MTHVTFRLTAKNRDQFRNSTLGNRVWATFSPAGLYPVLSSGIDSSFHSLVWTQCGRFFVVTEVNNIDDPRRWCLSVELDAVV